MYFQSAHFDSVIVADFGPSYFSACAAGECSKRLSHVPASFFPLWQTDDNLEQVTDNQMPVGIKSGIMVKKV